MCIRDRACPARSRYPAPRRRSDRGRKAGRGGGARVAARAQPGRRTAATRGALRRGVLMRRSVAARIFAEHLAPDDIVVLSLIHISEPTRLLSISYAVFCLK